MYNSRMNKILSDCDSEKEARLKRAAAAAAADAAAAAAASSAAAAVADAARPDEAARQDEAIIVLDDAEQSTEESKETSQEESKTDDAVSSKQASILAAKDASGDRKRKETQKGKKTWVPITKEPYECQLRGGRFGKKPKLPRSVFRRTPEGMVYCAICPHTPTFMSSGYMHDHHEKNKQHQRALAELGDSEKNKPMYQKALDLKDKTSGASLAQPVQEFRCKGRSQFDC